MIPFEMSQEQADRDLDMLGLSFGPAFEVRFFVPGVPQPGGSKRGFVVPRKGGGGFRVAIVEDAKKNAPWRAVVALAAQEHFQDGPLAGPLSVGFEFLMPRPKGHFGSRRGATVLKPSAPAGHAIKPDITKLIRSTEDALTGTAWLDDAQIVAQAASKTYTNDGKPGCWVTVRKE